MMARKWELVDVAIWNSGEAAAAAILMNIFPQTVFYYSKVNNRRRLGLGIIG